MGTAFDPNNQHANHGITTTMRYCGTSPPLPSLHRPLMKTPAKCYISPVVPPSARLRGASLREVNNSSITDNLCERKRYSVAA
ncbi:hypothetical protein PoB_003570400 [Plakobranchus ocellatus]|uniref:Uncharacterized protein n=1 Tax=Plakobranchus ocellatus TaxID=259542 RepID=A0AAV4AN25_9GAST|nr:hypothetical protein PoB_003570400 [Plakobranchus ocellatus]